MFYSISVKILLRCNTNFSSKENDTESYGEIYCLAYVIRLGREGRHLHSKFDWQMPNKFSARAVAWGIVIRICQTTLTGLTVGIFPDTQLNTTKGFMRF